jgi:hypothetical protein
VLWRQTLSAPLLLLSIKQPWWPERSATRTAGRNSSATTHSPGIKGRSWGEPQRGSDANGGERRDRTPTPKDAPSCRSKSSPKSSSKSQTSSGSAELLPRWLSLRCLWLILRLGMNRLSGGQRPGAGPLGWLLAAPAPGRAGGSLHNIEFCRCGHRRALEASRKRTLRAPCHVAEFHIMYSSAGPASMGWMYWSGSGPLCWTLSLCSCGRNGRGLGGGLSPQSRSA